jgi:hypothetical protein
MRPLVARFLVSDMGLPIPHKDAMAILGKLPLEELQDVFLKFADAMRLSAVPNMNGDSLRQHTEAPPASESPTG